MPRIAIGGFQHETNTFAPQPTLLSAFAEAGAWPGLTRGPDLIEAVSGANLPAAGFIEAAARRHQLVPLLWCAASPGGTVATAAFDQIADWLIADLRRAWPVDALYLDLHGAMVTADHADGEAALLARLRAAFGPDLPIVASLDLHANMSQALVDGATALVAYRTYPHIDMAETGMRAARLVDALLGSGRRAACAFRQIPFLIPLPAQSTVSEPAAGLYARLAELEAAEGVLSLSLTLGFPPADVADCGPAVFGYGADRAIVSRAVAALAAAVTEAEPAFRLDLLEPAAAIRHAMARTAGAGPPVILADTQDNPGGGAASDGVAVLQALLELGAENALLGLLADPVAAAAAHEAGIGAEIACGLGAGSGYAGARPVPGPWRVERLGDGRLTGTGPFYRGCRMDLGPMALLRRGGVRVAVASRRQQAADQAMFRHLGAEPSESAILVLKSSVHFRADFAPIAREILVVDAPGPNVADPRRLPYRRLRPGMRRAPGDTAAERIMAE